MLRLGLVVIVSFAVMWMPWLTSEQAVKEVRRMTHGQHTEHCTRVAAQYSTQGCMRLASEQAVKEVRHEARHMHV